MGTRFNEQVGPRLMITACMHGRYGIVDCRVPEAVMALQVTPDGSDWVTVWRDDEDRPTGPVELKLDLYQARYLHKLLGEAIESRECAVTHGDADR